MTPDDVYNELVSDVLKNGIIKDDRTGVGTISVFGKTMRFNLKEGFPLITTKRVYFKGVVEELLWMLRGCTNAKELDKYGVKIWNANATKEFLESRKLEYEEGELGPIYGHQWRHFGAKYKGSDADYSNEGIDQIKNVIELIKNDPDSRRIIISAWNPAANEEMALPACHCMCQFYVDKKTNELSCQMYQRSGDIGLGIPFNIASYALLTHIIAKMCDLTPKEFIHVIGDAHIYTNHIDALQHQIEQEQQTSPQLTILTKHDNIEDYTANDILLKDYNVFSKIKMQMAV
tara:strand:+ start:5125 stop:5991 length:867 start_codon:yes stop_codon:yes gene_type:complete